MTLDTALRIALINNPRLQASDEKLSMDYGDLLQAGLPANPSLSFSFRSSSVGVGREFGVVQDVLSLVTLAPRKRLATAMFEERKLNAAQHVLQLATEVKKAYFTVRADQDAFNRVTDCRCGPMANGCSSSQKGDCHLHRRMGERLGVERSRYRGEKHPIGLIQ